MKNNLIISWVCTLITNFLLLTSTHAEDQLDKPPLLKDFDVLRDGLEAHLPSQRWNYSIWAPGWILSDCKRIAEKANLSASTIETFNVFYDDCSSPWILCRHNASPDPLDHFFSNFGRIPVRARSHVKGAISLPDPKLDHAYNADNYIAIFSQQDALHHTWSNLNVFIHETGHSLDLGGAFAHGVLSSSDSWATEYAHDSHVPDSYAGKNALEDVAQNTVVAAYDLNVPGGFASVEPQWQSIEHQFAMVKKEQSDAGDLLKPGGMCTRRLENSPPVQIPVSGAGKGARRRRRQLRPNVELDEKLEVIEPSHFSTGPERRAAMPDVALDDGLAVIEAREFSTEAACEHY